MKMDPQIGKVMKERGRYAKGVHSTYIEVVDGSAVGWSLAHVAYCCCGWRSDEIVYLDMAEGRAQRHVEVAP